MDGHLPPVDVPSQAEKMIEKVIPWCNGIKEVSNRFRMEEIGGHVSF